MRFCKAPVALATFSVFAASFAAHAVPTVSFKAPADGQTISGSLKQSNACAPWQCNLDTTKFSNGTYTLMAVAPDNVGATSSTQRALTIKKAPPPVAESDIISRASADIAFANQSGYTAQVIGTYTSAPNIPESGINGTTLPNGETLRLGKLMDPANSLRKALAFQVISSDPTTSGGKRSELSIAPNIEMNKVYWIVFSAYVYDWGTLASTDNALFGTQMHSGDNSAGLSPSFGLYTSQYGRTFRVQARYSTSSDPTQSNSVSVRFTEYPVPFGQWADFVFKFKHNTSGNGFLQVWMNGQQIANYQGNLGYNTGYKDYAKFGYYNWTASSMNGTARKVLLRSPTIVSDPTGQTYTLEQISALIGSAMWPTRRQLRRSPYSRLGSRLRHYVAVYLAPRAVCCRNATTRTIAESRRRGCA